MMSDLREVYYAFFYSRFFWFTYVCLAALLTGIFWQPSPSGRWKRVGGSLLAAFLASLILFFALGSRAR